MREEVIAAEVAGLQGESQWLRGEGAKSGNAGIERIENLDGGDGKGVDDGARGFTARDDEAVGERVLNTVDGDRSESLLDGGSDDKRIKGALIGGRGSRDERAAVLMEESGGGVRETGRIEVARVERDPRAGVVIELAKRGG